MPSAVRARTKACSLLAPGSTIAATATVKPRSRWAHANVLSIDSAPPYGAGATKWRTFFTTSEPPVATQPTEMSAE